MLASENNVPGGRLTPARAERASSPVRLARRPCVHVGTLVHVGPVAGDYRPLFHPEQFVRRESNPVSLSLVSSGSTTSAAGRRARPGRTAGASCTPAEEGSG